MKLFIFNTHTQNTENILFFISSIENNENEIERTAEKKKERWRKRKNDGEKERTTEKNKEQKRISKPLIKKYSVISVMNIG